MKIKYKPIELDCIKWTEDNFTEVKKWLSENYKNHLHKLDIYIENGTLIIYVDTTDGLTLNMHLVERNDYIVIEPEGNIKLYDESMINNRFEVIE